MFFVFAPPRLTAGSWTAANVDTDQRCAGSAADDLASLAGHVASWIEECGARVAHAAAAES
jgi:hypothetical protein